MPSTCFEADASKSLYSRPWRRVFLESSRIFFICSIKLFTSSIVGTSFESIDFGDTESSARASSTTWLDSTSLPPELCEGGGFSACTSKDIFGANSTSKSSTLGLTSSPNIVTRSSSMMFSPVRGSEFQAGWVTARSSKCWAVAELRSWISGESTLEDMSGISSIGVRGGSSACNSGA